MDRYNGLRLAVAETPKEFGWAFDESAILDALDELEINILPVAVTFGKYGEWKKHGRRMTRIGTHKIVNGRHWITLNETVARVTLLNETLWHELTHAAQAERMVREGVIEHPRHFSKIYKQQAGSMGAEYDNNVFEAEARVNARKNSNKMLILETGN